MINDLKIICGHDGNLKGISSLIRRMKIDDIIKKLSNILCGMKNELYFDQISLVKRI